MHAVSMRHATTVVVALATVALVTGCSAQPPAITAPTPSASASPSPAPESSTPTELDRCSRFTKKAEKLLGSRVVKRDDRTLADGIEACWWQTDYTGLRGSPYGTRAARFRRSAR